MEPDGLTAYRRKIRKGGVGRRLFHATILAGRAFAVDSGLHVLLMKPLQPASFSKTCDGWRNERSYASGDGRDEVAHLEVDVPGLSATDSPLALDNDNGDTIDAALAGLLDLVFDFLNILVGIQVRNGLMIVTVSVSIPRDRRATRHTSSLLIRHDASAISLRILMFETSLWSMMRAWKRLEITAC